MPAVVVFVVVIRTSAGGHRVVSGAAPGVAAQDAARGQTAAAQQAVPRQRLRRVARAARLVAAVRAHDGRQNPLPDQDEGPQHQHREA